MNQQTAKRLRRLVRATSTDPKTDIARYDRLKRDWIKLPWNQRHDLALQLERAASIMVARTTPGMSGKTHLAVQA